MNVSIPAEGAPKSISDDDTNVGSRLLPKLSKMRISSTGTRGSLISFVSCASVFEDTDISEPEKKGGKKDKNDKHTCAREDCSPNDTDTKLPTFLALPQFGTNDRGTSSNKFSSRSFAYERQKKCSVGADEASARDSPLQSPKSCYAPLDTVLLKPRAISRTRPTQEKGGVPAPDLLTPAPTKAKEISPHTETASISVFPEDIPEFLAIPKDHDPLSRSSDILSETKGQTVIPQEGPHTYANGTSAPVVSELLNGARVLSLSALSDSGDEHSFAPNLKPRAKLNTSWEEGSCGTIQLNCNSDDSKSISSDIHFPDI